MAEHEHAWRQHCPRRICGWLKCVCGTITDGKDTAPAAKPPLPKAKP